MQDFNAIVNNILDSQSDKNSAYFEMVKEFLPNIKDEEINYKIVIIVSLLNKALSGDIKSIELLKEFSEAPAIQLPVATNTQINLINTDKLKTIRKALIDSK